MSDQSTNLALPFLAPAQAQKHVTVNESLLRLDALVQLAAVSATTAAQPASPSDGQCYILPAGKTGADWGAMAEGAIAYYRDGAWEAIAPREGFLAFVKDSDSALVHDGAAWVALPVVVADNSVTDAKLRDSAALSVIGRASDSSGDPADIAAGTDGHVLRRAGTSLAFGQIALAAIPDDCVTYAKLQNATQACFIGATGAGDLGERTPAQVLSDIAAMPLAGGTFTGHVLFTDNAYDIGASGAARPRSLYLGASVTVGAPPSAAVAVGSLAFFSGNVAIERRSASGASDGAQLYTHVNDGAAMASGDRLGAWLSGGAYDASSNTANQAALITFAGEAWSSGARGTRFAIELTANGSTSRTQKLGLSGAGLLTFDNNTSAGAGLKRSGAQVQARLGDDSADADFKAAHIVTSATDFLHKTTAALANGAGANAATLTNAPASGNPTKWIAVDDNGTTRYIPAW